jgi:cytochrome oxidase Cu insertion factor (SCO1/SenC/PrrC family)
MAALPAFLGGQAGTSICWRSFSNPNRIRPFTVPGGRSSWAAIDCASLSVVFDAAVEARRHDAVLILLDPRGQVRRMLDLTGAPDGVAVLERSDSEPLNADAY